MVVNALNSQTNSPRESNLLLKDIRECWHHFDQWTCSWISRFHNQEAHRLCQLGVDLNFEGFAFLVGKPDLSFEAYRSCNILWEHCWRVPSSVA